MTKLYFNNYYGLGLFINEDTKTFKVIKGALKERALFKYHVRVERIKEIYENIKRTYSRA